MQKHRFWLYFCVLFAKSTVVVTLHSELMVHQLQQERQDLIAKGKEREAVLEKEKQRRRKLEDTVEDLMRVGWSLAHWFVASQ